jgi:hypothetical protein
VSITVAVWIQNHKLSLAAGPTTTCALARDVQVLFGIGRGSDIFRHLPVVGQQTRQLVLTPSWIFKAQ